MSNTIKSVAITLLLLFIMVIALITFFKNTNKDKKEEDVKEDKVVKLITECDKKGGRIEQIGIPLFSGLYIVCNPK